MSFGDHDWVQSRRIPKTLCEMLGRLDLFCYDTCAKKKKKNLPVLDARRPGSQKTKEM